MSTVPFDFTDPLVAVNAWVLTALARRFAPVGWWSWLRPVTPVLAVLVAVFLRVVYSQIEGTPLSWDLLLRALASGGVAVLAHSQFRELVKIGAKKTLENQKDPKS